MRPSLLEIFLVGLILACIGAATGYRVAVLIRPPVESWDSCRPSRAETSSSARDWPVSGPRCDCKDLACAKPCRACCGGRCVCGTGR